jgi:uncharacterized integral membrane protein
MRYIKVFLLVLFFLLVMMFFVQNQASFSDPVTLRLDLLFLTPVESIPLPLYSIMLICFAMGALSVLLMLIWDRMTIMFRLSSLKREKNALGKKLEKLQADLDKAGDALRLAGQQADGAPRGAGESGSTADFLK